MIISPKSSISFFFLCDEFYAVEKTLLRVLGDSGEKLVPL